MTYTPLSLNEVGKIVTPASSVPYSIQVSASTSAVVKV